MPASGDPLRALAAEAAGCQVCDLWRRATQTVFGSGPVDACNQWLAPELELLDADAVLVALGAIAGQALFGPSFRVGAARGANLELDGHRVVATIHPSAVPRSRDSEERARAYAGLVEDLRRASALAT